MVREYHFYKADIWASVPKMTNSHLVASIHLYSPIVAAK